MNTPASKMNDLHEEDLEFRGGTLQLSTHNISSELRDNSRSTAEGSTNQHDTPPLHPSVLSGADSLTSSTASLPDVGIEGSNNAEATADAAQTVYPRYDMPFNTENIKDFFTFRNGVVETAIQECITVMLFPEDGEYLGSWLLTELEYSNLHLCFHRDQSQLEQFQTSILYLSDLQHLIPKDEIMHLHTSKGSNNLITLWDNEKERIVLLTSRLVMTIKYDFIAMKQLECKKTYLDDLDTIVIGELVYPPSSLVPRINGIATGVTTVVKDHVVDRLCPRPSSGGDQNTKLFDFKYFEPRDRNLRGVRLMWNKGEALPLKTMWNPFSQDVPFLTFASHPIYWHKDGSVEDRASFDMEVFAEKLQRAIEAMPSSACCIHHSPIVIESYVGVTSLLHNKTGLGFFKVRGKFSF